MPAFGDPAPDIVLPGRILVIVVRLREFACEVRLFAVCVVLTPSFVALFETRFASELGARMVLYERWSLREPHAASSNAEGLWQYVTTQAPVKSVIDKAF